MKVEEGRGPGGWFTGPSLAEWIGGLGRSQWQLLLALTLFFIVLGCFPDGISIVVLTAAVIMPLVPCVAVVLLATFPEIALWLPSTMLDRG